MRNHRTIRWSLAMTGTVFTASLGWVVKTQLDTSVGSSGLILLRDVLAGIGSDATRNVPMTILLLATGVMIGFLINGAARRIDVRLKAKERWTMSMLRREVGFARMLCRRPRLRFLVQDMWEDPRMLSDQLVLTGLPGIPVIDLHDKKGATAIADYLDVIHSHLTDAQLPYAILCGSKHRADAEAAQRSARKRTTGRKTRAAKPAATRQRQTNLKSSDRQPSG